LKGLDASIIPVSEISDFNPGFRIDAEFFARPAMEALASIRRVKNQPLGRLVSRVQHPVEVKREYEESGLLTVMAKDVRSNRTELSDPRYMPTNLRNVVSRNELHFGDILVTRTGANYGQSAPWKRREEAFACADILVLREPTIPSGYISSFLECGIGKPLVLRGGYGAGQPHIAPSYLADMLIPRFGELETQVDKAVERSAQFELAAAESIARAEQELLASIGLSGWTPPEPLTYTAPASVNNGEF
jgi:hypothetical protein